MDHRIALNVDLSGSAASAEQPPTCIELIPAGPLITGRDGRQWTFDQSAAHQVLRSFAERGIDLPIDWNHALQHQAPKGGNSPAAAWIERLEMRDDGALLGHVSWTPRGSEQVLNREYRFLSPVFDYDPATNRIVRLVSAGLTNTPNLRLTALNAQEDYPVALSPAVAAALGLASDATDEAAVAAIQQLKTAQAANSQAHDLSRFVPRADHDAMVQRAANAEQALADQRKAEHQRVVDAEIDAALKAGKITPTTVDYHRATCADETGLKRFREYVAHAPVIAPDQAQLDKRPNGATTALNSEERYVAEALGIAPEAMAKARHDKRGG